MRGSGAKYKITLKRKQRRRLEGLVRRRSISHWLVLRARIMVLSQHGRRVIDTAAALSIDEQRVRRWRKRYLEGRVDSLRDRCRGGRPREISEEAWTNVAVLVVQPPRTFGLAINRWTVRDLSRFVADRYGYRISRTSISRFLRGMALKPHRFRYWLNPRDPDVDAKGAEICRLYLTPPPKTTVLCIDEKPGVPLRTRIHPTRPIWPGRVARVEFEYQRHGTRCIFAAFNIRTGQVITRVERNRKTPRVLDFLDRLCAAYPRGPIVMVSDNISTRTGRAAQQWLARHPRVRFVFTPKHGSWLNQVEIWLSILSRKCLKGRSFANGRQIAAAVYAFTRLWNNEIGHPFRWTYTGKVLHA
jgi:transposase